MGAMDDQQRGPEHVTTRNIPEMESQSWCWRDYSQMLLLWHIRHERWHASRGIVRRPTEMAQSDHMSSCNVECNSLMLLTAKLSD